MRRIIYFSVYGVILASWGIGAENGLTRWRTGFLKGTMEMTMGLITVLWAMIAVAAVAVLLLRYAAGNVLAFAPNAPALHGFGGFARSGCCADNANQQGRFIPHFALAFAEINKFRIPHSKTAPPPI